MLSAYPSVIRDRKIKLAHECAERSDKGRQQLFANLRRHENAMYTLLLWGALFEH